MQATLGSGQAVLYVLINIILTAVCVREAVSPDTTFCVNTLKKTLSIDLLHSEPDKVLVLYAYS